MFVFDLAFLPSPSFPLFYFLDERKGRPWSLTTVVGAALRPA